MPRHTDRRGGGAHLVHLVVVVLVAVDLLVVAAEMGGEVVLAVGVLAFAVMAGNRAVGGGC